MCRRSAQRFAAESGSPTTGTSVRCRLLLNPDRSLSSSICIWPAAIIATATVQRHSQYHYLCCQHFDYHCHYPYRYQCHCRFRCFPYPSLSVHWLLYLLMFISAKRALKTLKLETPTPYSKQKPLMSSTLNPQALNPQPKSRSLTIPSPRNMQSRMLDLGLSAALEGLHTAWTEPEIPF